MIRTSAQLASVAILMALLLLPLDSRAQESTRELLKQAEVYFRLDDYGKAADLLASALKVTEAKEGADHPDVAMILGNLAMTYEAQNDFSRAEPLRKRALAILRKASNDEDALVDEARVKLANTERRLRKYAEAESLYRESIQSNEKVGPSADIGDALDGLAATYVAQDKYALAEPLYARSLKIYEDLMGPRDLVLPNYLINLASVYAKQAKYELAEPLYQRALTIRESRQLTGEPMAEVLDGLAEVSRGKRDAVAERGYRERAAAIRAARNNR